MKFIPHLEIASRIMTLIEEAEKEVIIVSPYVNVADWDKMKKCFERALKRGVRVVFITRKGAGCDLSPLKQLGIEPIFVENLHAKLYINDKYAIATSQNLYHYSDNHSIDIGYVTVTNRERAELVEFVNKYLVDLKPIKKLTIKKVDDRNFDDKLRFEDWQVEKIHQTFMSEFPKSDFTRAATYVFSVNLMSFADVMIDRDYIVKISKSRTDCNQILQKFNDIELKCIYEYSMELVMRHKTHYYLTFKPVGRINSIKLLEDYVSLTKAIQHSDIRKVLKKQQKDFIW